jgi:hypothetical protein
VVSPVLKRWISSIIFLNSIGFWQCYMPHLHVILFFFWVCPSSNFY